LELLEDVELERGSDPRVRVQGRCLSTSLYPTDLGLRHPCSLCQLGLGQLLCVPLSDKQVDEATHQAIGRSSSRIRLRPLAQPSMMRPNPEPHLPGIMSCYS